MVISQRMEFVINALIIAMFVLITLPALIALMAINWLLVKQDHVALQEDAFKHVNQAISKKPIGVSHAQINARLVQMLKPVLHAKNHQFYGRKIALRNVQMEHIP